MRRVGTPCPISPVAGVHNAIAGGYFSVGDDPARGTWFDDEMEALCATAGLLGLPVAVHTGGPEACKQAVRCGARSLEPGASADIVAMAGNPLEDIAATAGVDFAWSRRLSAMALPPDPVGG